MPEPLGKEQLAGILFVMDRESESRSPAREELRWTCVFDDAACLDDDHSRESRRFFDIVSNAEKSGIPPSVASSVEQAATLRVLESAKRLVEQHEPWMKPHLRAREAEALSLAAGEA